MDLELSKIYNLYEIFNDFNRLRMLIIIYNNSYTYDEIISNTSIKSIIVKHELDFLIKKEIVKEVNDKYIICDRMFNKIVAQIITYIK